MTKTLKRRELVNHAQGLKLLGSIVTWGMNGSQHKHADVVKALKNSDLPEGVAREILPRHAFTRASKKLSDERVIDVLKQDDDKITFQFTRKVLTHDEWEYTKETYLILDKVSGKVTCPVSSLEQRAQELLDTAMEMRTSSDITKIIQKLFDLHADLFPIRDKGGAYFIPEEHKAFGDKVRGFVEGLGGEMSYFPVPAGVGGEASVARTVKEGIADIIKQHKESVEAFNIHTRHGTLEEMSEKIQSTRLKVEAYAHYLSEQRDELLEGLKEADQELKEKINSLTQERAEAPIVERNGSRVIVYGHPVSAVVRWMGSVGWRWDEALAVSEALFGKESISEAGAKRQTHEGKVNSDKLRPASLTVDQQLVLERKRRELIKE